MSDQQSAVLWEQAFLTESVMLCYSTEEELLFNVHGYDEAKYFATLYCIIFNFCLYSNILSFFPKKSIASFKHLVPNAKEWFAAGFRKTDLY